MSTATVIFFSSIALLITLSIVFGFWPWLVIGAFSLLAIVMFTLAVRLHLRERKIRNTPLRIIPLRRSSKMSFAEGLRRIIEMEWDSKSEFGDVEDLR